MDKVSVIIPVYNGASTIEKCIKSVLQSTCDTYELEVVVVNNGSLDNTKEIIKSLCAIDTRIKFYSQENQGPAGSRNTGIDNATGDYITFCDSDDWVEPQWIGSMLSNIRKYNADMACCELSRVYDINDNEFWEEKTTSIKKWSRDEALEAFLDHKYLNGCLFLKLIKRSCIGDIRLDRKQWFLEDEPFVWKVLHNCKTVVRENTAYYHWYLHPESLCNESYSENKIYGIKCIADVVLFDCQRFTGGNLDVLIDKAYKFHYQRYFRILNGIAYYRFYGSQYENEVLSKVRSIGLKGLQYLNGSKNKLFLMLILVNYNITKKLTSHYLKIKKHK